MVEVFDSLCLVVMVKILFVVGEGEFVGVLSECDIYFDNILLMDLSGNLNFFNVKWEWCVGVVD